jgi:hypothetical protein
MKYFDELSKLESGHIKLDCLMSLIDMIDPHVHDVNDVDNVLYVVRDILRETKTDINATFQDLWDKVREESFREESQHEDEILQNFIDHNRFEKIVKPLMTE